jgi:hypothetical protein
MRRFVFHEIHVNYIQQITEHGRERPKFGGEIRGLCGLTWMVTVLSGNGTFRMTGASGWAVVGQDRSLEAGQTSGCNCRWWEKW